MAFGVLEVAHSKDTAPMSYAFLTTLLQALRVRRCLPAQCQRNAAHAAAAVLPWLCVAVGVAGRGCGGLPEGAAPD